MEWRNLIEQEITGAYPSAETLIGMVDEDTLDWKPSTGDNWMSTRQLLMHIVESCGSGCRGFVTGDWGMPEGIDMSELPPEDMLPAAEKLPSVDSVDEALRLLEEDRITALEMLAASGDEELAEKPAPAPWDPRPLNLGYRFLQMVQHLNSHKSQLFYYLKLQGKSVNTRHLWS